MTICFYIKILIFGTRLKFDKIFMFVKVHAFYVPGNSVITKCRITLHVDMPIIYPGNMFTTAQDNNSAVLQINYLLS